MSLLEESLGADVGAHHEERVRVHDGQQDVYDELAWVSLCNLAPPQQQKGDNLGPVAKNTTFPNVAYFQRILRMLFLKIITFSINVGF